MSKSGADSTQLSPQVRRIAAALSERIESGFYREGDWLPAERALADEFGVSRILIRSAVRELDVRRLLDCSANRRPVVRKNDPAHRDAVPGSKAARLSAAVSNRSIAAWMWPHRDASGSAAILQGIHEAIGADYRLVLGSATGSTWEQIHASESHFLRQVLGAGDVEGVVIGYLGGSRNLPLLQELRAANIPIVFVDHHPPAEFEGDYVGITNRRSAEAAVRHLLALGHVHVAHVSNYDDLSTVGERNEGYRRAIESVAGARFRPEFVIKDPGPAESEQFNRLEEPLRHILSARNAPTAIFAVSDVTAYRVIAALSALGIRVPEDVSIVGFDGIERWLPTPPFLTTVAQPFDEIGREAVELLRYRIDSPARREHRHVLLEAPLVHHASTAPPSGGKRDKIAP